LTFLFIEDASDGPLRAMYAYGMTKKFEIPTYGVWLPGYLVLTGLFSFIISEPLYSIRILNTVLGTLTIYFYFNWIRNIFDEKVALLSAAVLTFMPIHMGLSSTGLTETTLLFFVVFAFSSSGYGNKKSNLYVYFGIASYFLALTIRYEAWVLLPFFILFQYIELENRKIIVLSLIVLMIFPLFWTISNFLNTGDPFYGITAAKIGGKMVNAEPVGLFRGAKSLIEKLAHFLSPAFFLGCAFGLLWEILKRFRDLDFKKNISIVILMTLFFGIITLKFLMNRGASFQNRYVLILMICLLPFGVQLFANLKKEYSYFIAIIVILSMLISYKITPYQIYISNKENAYGARQVAEWIRTNKLQNEYFLITKSKWKSTYIPLYIPELLDHYLIASVWATDDELKSFIDKYEPRYIVTNDYDDLHIKRINSITSIYERNRKIVYKNSDFMIYKIDRKAKMKACMRQLLQYEVN
jgi:hypothetical protein